MERFSGMGRRSAQTTLDNTWRLLFPDPATEGAGSGRNGVIVQHRGVGGGPTTILIEVAITTDFLNTPTSGSIYVGAGSWEPIPIAYADTNAVWARTAWNGAGTVIDMLAEEYV